MIEVIKVRTWFMPQSRYYVICPQIYNISRNEADRYYNPKVFLT